MSLPLRLAAPTLAVVIGVASLGACGGDASRSTSAFCNELDRQLPGLDGPLADDGDLDALIDRYEGLGALAPLAVEDDWDRLTGLVRAAATAAIDDPDSIQDVADQTYATERAYVRITEWVDANCGLAMPAPGGMETTTVAPPPSDAPPAT